MNTFLRIIPFVLPLLGLNSCFGPVSSDPCDLFPGILMEATAQEYVSTPQGEVQRFHFRLLEELEEHTLAEDRFAAELVAKHPNGDSLTRMWLGIYDDFSDRAGANLLQIILLPSKNALENLTLDLVGPLDTLTSLYVGLHDTVCGTSTSFLIEDVSPVWGSPNVPRLCEPVSANALCGGSLPLPIISQYDRAASVWLRVDNWEEFAPELFACAPDLPACGANQASSRTWIDIFDGEGNRIYGHCNITHGEALLAISTTLPYYGDKPDSLYIEFHDRACDRKVTSPLIALP